MKFAEILAKATEVFGSQPEAEQWMLRPATGLEQRRPIELLETPAGAKIVEDFLGREDAAALAKIDRINPEPSGIDWNPKDDAGLRQSLSEAHTENQKLAAELTGLRTRMGTMEMIDRATSAEIDALKIEIAALKDETSIHGLIQHAARVLAVTSDLTFATPGVSAVARRKLVKLLGTVRLCLNDINELLDMQRHRAAKGLAQEGAVAYPVKAAAITWHKGVSDLFGHHIYFDNARGPDESRYLIKPVATKSGLFSCYGVYGEGGHKIGSEKTPDHAKALAQEHADANPAE